MNKITKGTLLVFTGLAVTMVASQTSSNARSAHADGVQVSTLSAANTDFNGIDPNNPVINTGDDMLSSSQRQDVTSTEDKLVQNIQQNSADFNDPNYANNVISNTEVRGKAGLTAKAAAKVLKAGLNKMGKKAYTRLAKMSGMEAVGLNWHAINWLADKLADFNGKVESALKKSLKQVGLSDYWAGVMSRVISDAFF